MKQMIGLALCRNSPLAGSLFFPYLYVITPSGGIRVDRWSASTSGDSALRKRLSRIQNVVSGFVATFRNVRVVVKLSQAVLEFHELKSWDSKKKGESVTKPCKTIIKPKEFHRFQFSVCFQWLYVTIFMYENKTLEVFSSALKQNLGEDPKSGNNGSTNFWWPSQMIHPSWR